MFKLPELPYPSDALAPVLSDVQMRTHHDKHHAKYIENLNKFLSDSGDKPATLEEVVVTANKREENTKDVPVSVGVLDGRSIEALHVEDLEDVSRIVPGVSFAAHNNGPNGPGQDNITIRGISSTVGNPTVGIYMDEVPIITITTRG